MSDNINEFDKIMSEFMENKYAGVSNPDLLERKNVIDDISKIIDERLLSKQPLSLAVTGIWGVGKSYILKELEKKYSERCIVFHYDCWKNDYYDEPLMGILSSISEQLNKIEAENPDERQKHYYRVMREVVFGISQRVIHGYTGIDIENIRNRFTDIKNLLKVKKKIEITSFDSLSNVSDVIEIVNNLLCGYMAYEGKKILFVVDELDRCLPDYAIMVLNRLHHICYESPIIQLVAVNDVELKRNINGLYYRGDDDIFARRYFNRFFTNYYKISVGMSSSELIRLCWEDFDEYFVNDSMYDYFGMLSEAVLKIFSIRERKTILNLLCIYHKSTLNSSREKYPIEVACAELLELFRIYGHIDQGWDVSNGSGTPISSLFDDTQNNELGPYTLTMYNVKQPDIADGVKEITNFFLECYGKKYDVRRAGESFELVINVFDKIIALLVGCEGANDASFEIGRIFNVLKHDKEFKKSQVIFDAFKKNLRTYEE